jgi:hypothetical protein
LVYRTGGREHSIPYSWMVIRSADTGGELAEKGLEAPTRKNRMFPNGPKAKEGRDFTRELLSK